MEENQLVLHSNGILAERPGHWIDTSEGKRIFDACANTFPDLPDPRSFGTPMEFYLATSQYYTSQQITLQDESRKQLILHLAEKFSETEGNRTRDQEVVNRAFADMEQKVKHQAILAEKKEQELKKKIEEQEKEVRIQLDQARFTTDLQGKDTKFLLGLHTEKIEKMAESIFALKSNLKEIEFKLESRQIGGNEDIKADIRKCQNEYMEKVERRLTAVEESSYKIMKSAMEAIKVEIRQEIVGTIGQQIDDEVKNKMKQTTFKAAFAQKFKEEDIMGIIDKRIEANTKEAINRINEMKAKIDVNDELIDARISATRSKLENKVYENMAQMRIERESTEKIFSSIKEQAAEIVKAYKETSGCFEDQKHEVLKSMKEQMEINQKMEMDKSKLHREKLNELVKNDFERLEKEMTHNITQSFTNSSEFANQTAHIHTLIETMNEVKRDISNIRKGQATFRQKGQERQRYRNNYPENKGAPRRHFNDFSQMDCGICKNRGFRQAYATCWRHNRKATGRREEGYNRDPYQRNYGTRRYGERQEYTQSRYRSPEIDRRYEQDRQGDRLREGYGRRDERASFFGGNYPAVGPQLRW